RRHHRVPRRARWPGEPRLRPDPVGSRGRRADRGRPAHGCPGIVEAGHRQPPDDASARVGEENAMTAHTETEAARAMPLIELTAVTKTYRTGELAVEVLHGIDLAIYPGEFVAIVGASGSGKSTLMNILGCLDHPTTGSYHFLGADVSGLGRDELARLRREAFGFVFQSYNFFDDASATENVEVPAIYAGTAPGK